MAVTTVKLTALDGKIDDVTRALKLTLAFEAELHDSGGSSLAYVHGMVLELEERLASLRAMRVSKFGETGR